MAAAHDFLDSLREADRAALQRLFVKRHVDADSEIIAHLDDSRDLFVLLSGRARATVYSASGKMVDFREIREGGLFGELSAIDGEPRSASVIALEPCSVARIPGDRFLHLLAERPSLGEALLRHLTLQIRRLSERVFEYSTMLVRERLVHELIRLARDAGGPQAKRAEVAPAPTHFELAARLSTHREAVSRELSALSKRGLIARRGRVLLVKDVDGLVELCGEP